MSNTRTAQAAYAEHQQRIDDQLAAMPALIAAHQKRQQQDPRNWGFAGDLTEVENLLRRAAEMLGQQRAQDEVGEPAGYRGEVFSSAGRKVRVFVPAK